jgi:alpha-L-fucosidase
LGINYLLGVGPTRDGEFVDDISKNMAVVGRWMARHAAAVKDVAPLPDGETASVPATAHQSARYLFAIPKFRGDGSYDREMLPLDTVELELNGTPQPDSVTLMSDGSTLKYKYSPMQLKVTLPVEKRSNQVDVVEVDFK